MNRITNRRWALSAFGTASAAALGSGDTVYCCTPVHHATGILVCVGGAVAGGARLAVATRFEASTFWDEIRRYGVTVVFYAGRLLREIAHAPHDPAERHHPVRLFAGSGLPRALWTRLVERFGPVGILEFYASTEGNAVLANLSGEKVGAVGRPLPGSAEVALARYDAAAGAVEEDAAGFARRCRDGETGLLLARIDRDRGVLEGRPLRGVFETGDAWSSTGDLFRRDADGDYWLVDHAADLMRTRDGFVPSLPVEDAIGAMDAVDHAVAYGVPVDEDGLEIPVAAVVRREGRRLDPAGLFDHVERSLEASSRPLVVRVVDEIPLTAGFRPVKAPLRAQGLDFAGDAWWLDAEARTCRPFDAAARERVRR